MAGTYKNYSVGILEAPSDGAPYARKDGDWTQIAVSTPEVFTYDTFAEFPVTGSNNTLYVDKSTSKVYFYNSGYIETKTAHNASSGIQGGTTNEYYHLTEQQRALVLGINGNVSTSTLTPITVTDNEDGTVTTGSVTMLLKVSTALDAEARSYVLAGIGPIALTINTKYFLVGDWNNGSPIQRIEASTATTINDYTISLIGILTRGISGDIYYTDIGQLQLDANTKILRRLDDSQGLIIKTSGGIMSSSAGRYLQITAARYFIASNIKYVSALDTTGAGRFSQMHGDSTAGFTETTDLQQINNTQYWDTSTNALVNLSANRFAVRWVFQLIDSPDGVYVFIGTAQYTTLAAARSALLTNDLPVQLQQYLSVSVLIAKVIVQQGTTNVIEVDNIVNTNTQSIATSDHNQLSSLQGGSVGEYYHLTGVEHETLSELATGRFSPTTDSATAFQVMNALQTDAILTVDTASAGNVGIGTTNTATLANYVTLTIGDNDATKSGLIKFRSTYNSGDGAEIFQMTDGAFAVNINGSNRALTMGPSGTFYCTKVYSTTTASAANVVVDSAGLLQRSTSARKYKTNITNITNIDTSFVYQIEPVKYTSLGEYDDKNMWHFGIIADQVDELGIEDAKMLVNYEVLENGTKQVEGFQYERLTVLLLAELQKLRKEVDELKAQLNT